MAERRIKAAVTLTLIAITLLSITGPSLQQDDCVAAIVSLAPCTDYITGSSSAPTAQCCLKFAAVAGSEPICLCMIVNGGGSRFGIQVNQTRALALPDACNVQTPPASRCNATAPSPSVAPPGGGNSGGGDSAGSFLRPSSLPIVFSVVTIVIGYLLMSSMIFLA